MKKTRHLVSAALIAAFVVSLASLPVFALDSGGYGSPAPSPSSGGYGSPAPAAPAPGPTAADVVWKMSDLLAKAPAEGHWQVSAADLAKMIAEKKTDFIVVDVRPTPPGQQGGRSPVRSSSPTTRSSPTRI